MSFGKRLKEARKTKKLTQEYVANLLGIDDTTISKYENDKSEPDNETLNKLCELYGVNTHWIHTGDGQKGLSDVIKKSSVNVARETGVKYETFDPFAIFDLVDRFTDEEIIEQFNHVAADKEISPEQVRAHLSYVRFLKSQKK